MIVIYDQIMAQDAIESGGTKSGPAREVSVPAYENYRWSSAQAIEMF